MITNVLVILTVEKRLEIGRQHLTKL